jgi:hypothetical protein
VVNLERWSIYRCNIEMQDSCKIKLLPKQIRYLLDHNYHFLFSDHQYINLNVVLSHKIISRLENFEGFLGYGPII